MLLPAPLSYGVVKGLAGIVRRRVMGLYRLAQTRLDERGRLSPYGPSPIPVGVIQLRIERFSCETIRRQMAIQLGYHGIDYLAG